jgi:hypothetical protein
MKLLKQPILNTNPTKNNRMYPIEVLESIKKQINERNSSANIGTIGYPEGLDVSLSDAAFKYSNAVIEKDVLYVDIETIHTPEGVELRRMLDEEQDLRFRPGGQATLKGDVPEETHNLLKIPKYVNEDYQLITIAAITPDEDAINF